MELKLWLFTDTRCVISAADGFASRKIWDKFINYWSGFYFHTFSFDYLLSEMAVLICLHVLIIQNLPWCSDTDTFTLAVLCKSEELFRCSVVPLFRCCVWRPGNVFAVPIAVSCYHAHFLETTENTEMEKMFMLEFVFKHMTLKHMTPLWESRGERVWFILRRTSSEEGDALVKGILPYGESCLVFLHLTVFLSS